MDRTLSSSGPAARIFLTPGDPAGIGPAVMLRAWQRFADDLPLTLCGPADVWRRAAHQIGADPARLAGDVDAASGVDLLPPPGRPDGEGARAAWRSLDEAIEGVDGRRDRAIVTGPIAKAPMLEAGFPYPGHTEYLARRAGVERVLMVMSAPRFHVGLHTVHIPLAEVPARVEADGLVRDLELLGGYLERLGEFDGPIAVCGLNPHAGEEGRLGTEESVIAAALARVRAAGGLVEGPVPGDTAFVELARGGYSGVLAMYHDQGLGPFKVRHFRDGVNVTVGLPYVRTSPDHGTAFELAADGAGAADPASAVAAVELAARLCGA